MTLFIRLSINLLFISSSWHDNEAYKLLIYKLVVGTCFSHCFYCSRYFSKFSLYVFELRCSEVQLRKANLQLHRKLRQKMSISFFCYLTLDIALIYKIHPIPIMCYVYRTYVANEIVVVVLQILLFINY